MSEDKLDITMARIETGMWKRRAEAIEARYEALAGAAEAMLVWMDNSGPIYDRVAAALALPEAEPTKGEPSVQDAS